MSGGLENRFQIHFKNNIAGFHACAKKIVIENNETARFENSINIFVEDLKSNEFIYNFQIRCEIPGSFFTGHSFYNDFIAICIEDYLYLFNRVSEQCIMHKLNGFFDFFYPLDDSILIGTDTHLVKINPTGEIDWVSNKLAMEKLSIKTIEDNIILGAGNWGKPDGWKSFSLSLYSGVPIKEYDLKENRFWDYFKKMINKAAFLIN